MICFRDMSFCSDAFKCANREGCGRYFNDEQREAALRWWGGEGAPVSMMTMKNNCEKWREA